MSKFYNVDDIIKLFQKQDDKIEDLECLFDKCCSKIPINIGNGIGLFNKLYRNKWEFKSLIAGSNITITDNGNDLTINSTGGGTVTCEDIDTCLGISALGASDKYLNEQGSWQTITIPTNFITSVSDTATVDLTVTAGDLTADVKLTLDQIGFGDINGKLTGDTNFKFNSTTGLVLNKPTFGLSATASSALLRDNTFAFEIAGDGFSMYEYGGTGRYFFIDVDSKLYSFGDLTGGTAKLDIDGSGSFISLDSPFTYITNLATPGTLMVVADGTGLLSKQAIPTGTVTSVAALTLGTTGTDLSSTVANSTTTPVITLNVPTASATNRGVLSTTDWSTFNSKIDLTSLSSTATGLTYTNTTGVFSLTSGYVIPTTTEETNWNTAYTNRITSLTTTGSSGASTLITNTLNIPNYTIDGLLPSQGSNSGKYLTTNGSSASWASVAASTIFPYISKTANYTLTTSDYLVDATSNTFTLTLLTAVGNTGQTFCLKNSGTGIVTVNTTSSQTIDGSLTFTLLTGESITVESDNANWKVIAYTPSVWIDWSGTTIVGWSSYTTKIVNVCKNYKTVNVFIELQGTSNATTSTLILPITSPAEIYSGFFRVINNGATVTSPLGLFAGTPNSTTLNMYRDAVGNLWTNSGTKSVWGQYVYKIN